MSHFFWTCCFAGIQEAAIKMIVSKNMHHISQIHLNYLN